jgi:putative DNA primase/helicase
MLAAKRQTEGQKDAPPRLLVRAKSNLGPCDGGFGYEIQTAILHEPAIETSEIKWLGKIEGEARDLIAGAEEVSKRDDNTQKLAQAITYLREMLKDGPVTRGFERMVAAGHSKRAIDTAKRELHIISEKGQLSP